MSESNEPEWLAWADAYALLRKHYENPKAIFKTLVAYARAGSLRTRAAELMDDLGVTADAEIPLPFWWRVEEDGADVDWETGSFRVLIKHDKHSRTHWSASRINVFTEQFYDLFTKTRPKVTCDELENSANDAVEPVYINKSISDAELVLICKGSASDVRARGITQEEYTEHIQKLIHPQTVTVRRCKAQYKLWDLIGPQGKPKKRR